MKKKELIFLAMSLAIVALLLSSCSNAPKNVSQLVGMIHPYPANGTIVSTSTVTLKWKVNVPESWGVTYSLYFSTNPEPLTLIATGLTNQSYTLKNLKLDNAYSWRIVARDNKGHVVEGPVWQFVYRKIIKQTRVNTIVEETIGTVYTLDPAWAYTPSSGEAIYQLYDNLIQYDGTSTKKFIPMISTNVPNEKDGTILNNGKTFIFHIRKNVQFHNGDILTPQDVVYSLERSIIFDRTGGPSWMLAEPIFPKISDSYVDSITQCAVKLAGVKKFSDLFTPGTRTPKNAKYRQALLDTFKFVSKAFEIKGDDVIINLPHPYPPFLSILAHTSNVSAIIDKKWAIAHGAWPGTANTWWKYHNPSKDPLRYIEDGSGPFFLKKWDKGKEIVFERFDKYWAGPAKIVYGIIKRVDAFTTRKLDLESGKADMIYVPINYISQFENIPNVTVVKGLPALTIFMVGFVWNVKSSSYIGSGKLDGNGIPPDFFSHLNVRKAFEYLFPYKAYIHNVLDGYAITPNGAIPKGLLGYNPKVPPTYHQDLAKAAEYFKKAYNGELWKKGFEFTLVYNKENFDGRTAAEMIKAFAKKINPKFRINVSSESWSSFLDDYYAGKLPMFYLGWSADYPDPYDFAQPYYSSKGSYGSTLGEAYVKWAKSNMDPLLNEVFKTTDRTKLSEIYQKMNELAYENALYIWIDQPLIVHVQRSDIKGWYYNPARSGVDFYSLSK